MCTRISLFFEGGEGKDPGASRQPAPDTLLRPVLGGFFGEGPRGRRHRNAASGKFIRKNLVSLLCKKRARERGAQRETYPVKVNDYGVSRGCGIRGLSVAEVLPKPLHGRKPYILVDFNLD